MRDSRRSRNVAVSAFIAGQVVLSQIPVATASHAEMAPMHKSAKTCNVELAEHAAEIERAGESAAAFFHACWTKAKLGAPTPIEADVKVETRPDATPAPRAPVPRAPVPRAPVPRAPVPRAPVPRAPVPSTRAPRIRAVTVLRDESRVTRHRVTPAIASGEEAQVPRAPSLVERREPREVSPPAGRKLPPIVESTADTLGRVLRAAGLPPVQVPVLVPGTLDVVPVTLAPR